MDLLRWSLPLSHPHNILVGRMDDVDVTVTDHETRFKAAEIANTELHKQNASVRAKANDLEGRLSRQRDDNTSCSATDSQVRRAQGFRFPGRGDGSAAWTPWCYGSPAWAEDQAQPTVSRQASLPAQRVSEGIHLSLGCSEVCLQLATGHWRWLDAICLWTWKTHQYVCILLCRADVESQLLYGNVSLAQAHILLCERQRGRWVV